MTYKRVGWCRIKKDLVLDQELLVLPFLQDDMDVYVLSQAGVWGIWTSETQRYHPINKEDVPEEVQLAMMMLS